MTLVLMACPVLSMFFIASYTEAMRVPFSTQTQNKKRTINLIEKMFTSRQELNFARQNRPYGCRTCTLGISQSNALQGKGQQFL